MKNYNRIGLTWIGYFSYALAGALVVVTGMVMETIAKNFNLSIIKTSNIFTFLNAGILVSILVNNYLIKIISIKKQIIYGFFLVIISLFLIIKFNNIFLFSLSIFILGIVSGMTMSISTYLITYLYDEKKRVSILLISDSFFSMSGILFPFITSLLLSNKICWSWIYVIIEIIYLVIFLISITINFPKINKINKKKSSNINIFNIEVIILSLSALLYILGQLSLVSWIPEYAIKSLKIDISIAGKLISNFWTFYMIGMWCFSAIIRFFDLKKIIIILTGISAILTFIITKTMNITIFKYAITALGFFSSSIYTIIITLGSMQTKISSPKIINIILTSGTFGTLLTFIITGPIVDIKGINISLSISNILYTFVFILYIIYFLYKNQKKNTNN
ncbi:Protein TsgA [Buchnera aphidicola (Neophyllaphis podocarpi)]|uniref:MFS transporter TsgA n=1 Tax=Buchnera aphidicola TaxID=9 RepID=UPI0034647461